MLCSKMWSTAFVCSLIFFIAFSVSTGSAHAASKISYTQLNFTQLKMPHSEGPPGCEAIQLNDKSETINYKGHRFNLEQILLGWYYLTRNGTCIFCDQVLCVNDINADNSTVPAGVLGISCGEGASFSFVSKRTNPGGGGDGITNEAPVGPNVGVESCAQYWPGGLSGPQFYVGWGCRAGEPTYTPPYEL